ncbi:MAG: L-threonylcarbamoyladenylate synthase [Acidobacteriota bacterium]
MTISQTAESLSRISDTIKRGGVIAFRTDTFYGLGADPFNVDAIGKIKDLKGRDDGKPILIVISDGDQVDRFISKQTKVFALLAERFWPGPLTLIGSAAANVPEEVTAGTGTVGVRLPDDDQVRALVHACGGALTATSANPGNQPPAKTAAEVRDYFGDTLDLIVDSGTTRTDMPSTVVDVTETEARLIREGIIPWTEIRTLIQGG